MKFVKKAIVVEARRFINWERSSDEIKSFIGTHFINNVELQDFSKSVQNNSSVTAFLWDCSNNDWMTVRDGQWIVRGVEGRFYPCDHSVFVQTYDKFYEEKETDAIVDNDWQEDYTERYNSLGEDLSE